MIRSLILDDPGLIASRLNKLESRVQEQDAEIRNLHQQNHSKRYGSTYIRWGKHTCPSNISEIIYTGYAAGGWWNSAGSPTNYLCMPSKPNLSGKTTTDGHNFIYGVEYETNFWNSKSSNEDAPCAVCMPTSGSTSLMIPGRNECFTGWTKHYSGYLGTNRYDLHGATDYVCVDKEVEYPTGGQKGTDGALFYPVVYQCGALPCPPYDNNQVAECVVCTK